MKAVIYVTDRNGVTSPVDVINVPRCYTVQRYIKDCKHNADPEWVAMLESAFCILLEWRE